MSLALRVYLILLCLGIICLGSFLSLYLIRYQSRKNLFVVGIIGLAIFWVFSCFMEVVSPSFEQKRNWFLAQYLFLVLVPSFWLGICASLSQLTPSGHRRILLPAAGLGLGLFIAFLTSPWHSYAFPRLFLSADGLGIERQAGPVYYIYIIYLFTGILSGFFLLISSIRYLPPFRRRRSWMVFASVLSPMIAALSDMLYPQSLGSLDLAPLAALISCLFLFIGTARWSLLNPLPLARSDFVEKMADPVIVLDENNDPMYANERARQLAAGMEENSQDPLRGLGFLSQAVLEHSSDQDICLDDGRYQAAIRPVYGVDGRVIARIISLREMTQLRLLTEGLEIKVRERTADLEKLAKDLEREVAQEKLQEERLSRSLEEKELLLRELNHRVKNNLQVVSSLIRLQTTRTADRQARIALESSLGRIHAISLVHERMYGTGSELGRVDAGAYLRDLVGPIASIHDRSGSAVRIRVDGGGICLGLDAAVNIGLITNEAVTNAYKHVFSMNRGSILEIVLSRKEDGRLLLEIQDDGPGYPQVENGKDSSQGLGMSIIRSICSRLGGSMSLTRGTISGARLSMELPSHIAVDKEREEKEHG